MTCPCCVSYCHARNPCLADIRIRVTWGPISAVSSPIAVGTGGVTCGGVGSPQIEIGSCPDRPVQVRLQIGGSSGSSSGVPVYEAPSCCQRTGVRTARIFGGKVWCIVRNGPVFNYEQARRYDFSFASLDAAAVITKSAETNVGGTSKCSSDLTDPFIETVPTIELLVSNPPLDFCSRDAMIGGVPAASGPYGTYMECLRVCGNPLP